MMELHNKFEKIVYDATYNCSFDESYVIKQCTIICLEEQIKLLRGLWDEDSPETHVGSFECDIDYLVTNLRQQLKLLKNGND